MAGNGYLSVYETLLNRMENHLLTPGMQLPSEMELAQELGVSRMTARKALIRLEDENRIFRRVGVGTFVKSAAVASDSPKHRFNIGIETRQDSQAERPPMMQIISEAQRACSEYDCNLLMLSREELLAGENIDAAFFPHLEPKDFPEALQLSRHMPAVLLNRITDESTMWKPPAGLSGGFLRMERRTSCWLTVRHSRSSVTQDSPGNWGIARHTSSWGAR